MYASRMANQLPANRFQSQFLALIKPFDKHKFSRYFHEDRAYEFKCHDYQGGSAIIPERRMVNCETQERRDRMAEGPEIDSKEYYKKSNFIDGRISDNSEKGYGLRTKMNLTFEST